MEHFVYMWYDRARHMFYIGSHSGSIGDEYISSSRWFNGEYRYRPADFRRRLLAMCSTRNEAQKLEGSLLARIKSTEFGTKYYNMKIGKPKGCVPWNKGKTGIYSPDLLKRRSAAMMGNKSNTGKPQPHSADNGKRGAAKQSATVTGRRRVVRDSRIAWAYPGDSDYPG